MRTFCPATCLRALLALVACAFALPAAAQTVDPALVGMWRLQWVGPEMFWQVRGDGHYRLIGTGARPNEHWGRMQASADKWSSEWAKGTDGGSYELNGNTWTVNGSLGPGVWQRVWPSGRSSPAACPYLDAAPVEELFGNAVRFSMRGPACLFSSTRVGIHDELSISITPIDRNFYLYTPTSPAPGRALVACKQNAATPDGKCVTGLGEAAVLSHGNLRIMKNNMHVIIRLSMQPSAPELFESDVVNVAREVLNRF